MYVRYINKQGFSVCRGYIVSSAQAQNLMEALYDEQTWKEDRYSFFQLDKQYLKEVTGIFCDGDIQTLFEKNAEKRQALAEALRKDILENGGQTVKDQPCAMLMFDYAGIPSEGYMDEWGMNVPAVQEGESVSTSVLVYPAYKRTLAIWKKQDILFLWMSCLLSILMFITSAPKLPAKMMKLFPTLSPFRILKKQITVIKSVTIKRNSWKP